MSFSAVASYSNNRRAEMATHAYEDLGADFFDQFLTYSPEDNETLDFEQSVGCDSANVSSSSIDEVGDLPCHLATPWASEDHVASFTSLSGEQFYELSGRAAISDTELLSLEGIKLESPQIGAHSHSHSHSQRSLPASPTPTVSPAHQLLRRKNRIVESLSKTFQKATAGLDQSILRSPIRKQKSTPKMMGATHGNHSSGNLDLWRQKLGQEAAKFNFDFERDDAPLSPPPSTRAPDASRCSHLEPQKADLFHGFPYKAVSTQQPHMARPTAYDTPLSTPTLDHYPSRRTSQQLRSENALYPITPQAQNASGSWSQLPGSPDVRYGASSMYAEIESPLWWNHATAPMAQPSPNHFHSTPQRPSKTLAMQFQNDLAHGSNHDTSNDLDLDLGFGSPNMANGLMIQMPASSAQHSFVVGTPPPHPPSYFSSPHSQPQPIQHRRQQSGHRHASHHVRSRHPQLSSPVIRKSRSTSSDSDSPPPHPQAFHVRKRKTKASKHSTPRTPTAGAVVDFVNFTPSDSRKILTGVAPSGSSKTKARREKEALDKRRKLSQAAVKAVIAAGGNVDRLLEEELFV